MWLVRRKASRNRQLRNVCVKNSTEDWGQQSIAGWSDNSLPGSLPGSPGEILADLRADQEFDLRKSKQIAGWLDILKDRV